MNFELKRKLKTLYGRVYQTYLWESRHHRKPRPYTLKTQNSKLKTLGMYVLLGAIAFVMLFPLLWLISTSFKSPAENIFQFPPPAVSQSANLPKFPNSLAKQSLWAVPV